MCSMSLCYYESIFFRSFSTSKDYFVIKYSTNIVTDFVTLECVLITLECVSHNSSTYNKQDKEKAQDIIMVRIGLKIPYHY